MAMNLLAATVLHSLLPRDGHGLPRGLLADRRPTGQPALDWDAETRPLIFRSEAFAEDLDDLLVAG